MLIVLRFLLFLVCGLRMLRGSLTLGHPWLRWYGRFVGIGSKGTAGPFNFVLTGPVMNDDQFYHVAVTWSGDTAASVPQRKTR